MPPGDAPPQDAANAEGPPGPLRPISHAWLPQCSLLGAGSDLWPDEALRGPLEAVARALAEGRPEEPDVRDVVGGWGAQGVFLSA